MQYYQLLFIFILPSGTKENNKSQKKQNNKANSDWAKNLTDNVGYKSLRDCSEHIIILCSQADQQYVH